MRCGSPVVPSGGPADDQARRTASESAGERVAKPPAASDAVERVVGERAHVRRRGRVALREVARDELDGSGREVAAGVGGDPSEQREHGRAARGRQRRGVGGELLGERGACAGGEQDDSDAAAAKQQLAAGDSGHGAPPGRKGSSRR